MLELAQQSRQPHNHHKPGMSRIGTEFKETQHTRLQLLANRMYVRLTNANHKIDREVFEVFCKRVLAVTFQNWMCKP